ncbi:MAG: S8 family serine peptidase [Polyangiaceae bacterium]
MRLRFGSSVALLSLITLTSGTAAAQSWGPRLVRALDRVGASRLVTDDHGKVHVSAILPPGVSPGAVGLSGFDEDSASMQLTPAQVIALGDAHPELNLFFGPPLKPLLNVSKSWTRAETFRNATGFDGTGVAVGILDTGIDILHPDFRNADGSTRIKWLLQIGASGGKHPEMEKQYCNDHGATCLILDEADINAAIAQNQTAGSYDGSGHGTHVASIAAGNGGLMSGKKPKYIGVAPGADLLIGAMDIFHDDDVAYVTQFLFDRADERKQPCVVNLSLGSDYGAHDGSDLLGKRLARFVGDDKPGHAITVAAGNSGSLYLPQGQDLPWGIHTETEVYPDADVHVPMWAPKSQSGRVYLWITFDPGDEVSVGLDGPGGTWLGDVAPGHENAIEEENRTAGIVNNKFKEGAALVPPTNGAVVVWSGKWDDGARFAVHLSGHGHAQMWLTVTGDLEEGLVWFEHGIKQGTINVPASDPSLLSVGCTINRIAWPTVDTPGADVQLADGTKADSVCYFSSAGPTPDGVMKPEISAPGGFVVAAMAHTADPRLVAGTLFDQACPQGTTNCWVADETHGVAAGTSMSSPHVAGAVALLYQANPKLTQARVTEILQAGARYPKGDVKNERQLGVGELDMLGALRALGDEEADFANPDPAKSWYVLSSAYARPDSTWPVEGTIELRRSDGEVAHALSGNLISLDVTNGVVLQQPTKIRHGLYRFKVAGLAGHGGESMTVNVAYDGKSLGARELPIESDIWRSTVAADAVGGCAIPRENKPGSSAAWSLSALALLAGLTLRKRSRRDATRG